MDQIARNAVEASRLLNVKRSVAFDEGLIVDFDKSALTAAYKYIHAPCEEDASLMQAAQDSLTALGVDQAYVSTVLTSEHARAIRLSKEEANALVEFGEVRQIRVEDACAIAQEAGVDTPQLAFFEAAVFIAWAVAVFAGIFVVRGGGGHGVAHRATNYY